MKTTQPFAFLRQVLTLDGLVTLPTSLLMTFGSSVLANYLSLPAWLLFYAGLFLMLYAVLVWRLGRHHQPSSVATGLVILTNFAWVLGCLWLLSRVVRPNTLGVFFLALHVVIPGVFGMLQTAGLRAARRDAQGRVA